jgi:hypothetical protein
MERGVVDGDGHLKNRDGMDTDIIVLASASYDLVVQFEGFIKYNRSWASTNTISRFIQRHSSLFTTSEERLIEGKRCLKVFLSVAETFTE